MEVENCPECGAPLVSARSCSDYFNQMLAWDYADAAGAGRVHHLTVLCYNLQHPKAYSREALKEAIEVFKGVVDGSIPVGRLRKHVSEAFDLKSRNWSIKGNKKNHGHYSHKPHWSFTAYDAVKDGIKEYPRHVEEWAKAVCGDVKKTGRVELT